ncbi:MAG: type III PLP-dependent enzyme [Acetobacteraceae bacterium]|nr:type III PLP-dependent enzyme [Acetobacteraceae bacterium]
MPQLRFRSAVSPVRRRLDPAPAVRATVDELVRAEHPAEPVHCLRPHAIVASARAFRRVFPGEVLYAVKCNPDPAVLRAVWAGGVRHFDCASTAEVTLVRTMFPEATIHFMHPVKSRPAIREAWRRQGVRDFVLDTADELAKILEETEGGEKPGLFVRLAMPKGGARYDLSGKFGATVEDAAALLRAARPHAASLGVHFHVGSQCMDPGAYGRAFALVADALARAQVPIEVIDVGGGFPVSYPDLAPPPLDAYMTELEAGFRALGLPEGAALWAEPGRALVAAGGSVVVQVQLRRGDALYVNDGVYGSLSDAGAPGFRFPARLVRASAAPEQGFALFGPTCDSADRMEGPFVLPADIREGDWIEIGQLGAYGAALRTAFNGFDRARIAEVADPPMLVTPGYELSLAA